MSRWIWSTSREPFNSNADYNVLFAEKRGEKAHAQIKAFEDTWEWGLEAAQEYAEVLRSGHDRVAKGAQGDARLPRRQRHEVHERNRPPRIISDGKPGTMTGRGDRDDVQRCRV